MSAEPANPESMTPLLEPAPDAVTAELSARPKSARKGGRPRKARGAATSSDASDSRWTVRGIPPNVRAMAAKAAAERGTTLGDWLSEAIVAVVRGTPPEKAGLPAKESPPDLAKVVLELADRLGKLEARKGLLARLFTFT